MQPAAVVNHVMAGKSWRRHATWAVIAIAAAIALGYGILHFLFGPELPAHTAVRSDLIQTIVASGRVETPLRVDIGSQITGTVASIPVAEGKTVKAGQTLIVLERGEAQASVEQAKAAVAQAQARLRQVREVALPAARQALRQAEINLQNTQRQYERTRQLRSQGFVGQSQLDDAQRNLDLAESQLRNAQLQVAATRERGSDYLVAQTALEQAQASLRIALAKLDYTTIKAPADGTLIARNVERGDVVQPGRALMVLSPAGRIQLVVQVDERNLSNIRIGQKALASADAYPEQRFQAELVYINPAIDPQRGAVEVKFDVADPPDYLRQDMTVSVDIEVARRTDAVAVPSGSVHNGTGAAPWVMKVEDGRARRQTVKPGIRGSGMVEIVEGLKPGDLILSSPAGLVRDGQRVRAQATAGGGSS